MTPLITPHEAARVESGSLRWQGLRSAYAGPNTSWGTLRFLQDGSPLPERTPTPAAPPSVIEVGRTAQEPCCEPLTRRESRQLMLWLAIGLAPWVIGLGYVAVQVWRWWS